MFDRLIESNSAGAEFKPRRKFFMVSSVVVGIMFLSAVVFSLYAQDIDLGTEEFEISAILSPAEDIPEPEPPREQPQQRNEQQSSELPSRPQLIATLDMPEKVPTEISTIPNTIEPIPPGLVVLDPGRPASDGNRTAGTGDGSSSADIVPVESEVVKLPEPPPVPKTEPKPVRTVSKGVVNGTATFLPRPPYPPTAKAIGITGDVNVQVLINEQGDVVSANAITGHVTLKAEAERAARRAKFKPTTLSGEPVKVTGVIIYRFSK